MSVRHIDFVKIKPSKCLMVEVRPLRCYIATPCGVMKTGKWMSYEHWKELHLLLNDVITSYEESMLIGSPIQTDRHETKRKDGHLIQIGYMFMARNTFVMPRDGATWTDDEEEDQTPRDKDGRYRALIPCGERLVVSVQLKNQHPIPRKNKNLCQALDSPYVVVNTLPDYIPSTEENCLDSSLVLLQHKRNNLKSQTGKSDMRPKRLKPKILDRDSGFYLHQGNSKLGTSSDDSSDQSQDVIRRVDQDAVHLCRDTVNQYSSYRKKYVRDNRHSESDQSSAKECRKNFENLNSDVLTESSADIASLSDQLQRKYNCSWSLIGVKCFGSDIKDKKEYIDDNSMKTVNTGNADIVGGAGKSKCISCLNLDVNCEVPCICNYSSNYRSRGRGSAVGGASVSHNKEMVIKSSWQCSKNSAFVNNDSRKEEHLLSSQKKNSNSSKENPGIGIGKNNLRETRDSSLADSTTEVVTSNPESIKKQDACDGDNNLDDNISAFPKSSCLQSGNSDVGKSLSNLDCFGYLQKSAISPIRERAWPGGRRKKNVEVKRKKMQHLFGNEGSIIEKTEPKVPAIKEEPELSSGEYTPPLKKSLAAENVHFPLPDYIPSPICREQAPGSCERNASSVQTGIEDPDNDRLHCNRSTFGENKGEISFRRSERLQDKVTKALYDVSLIFSSDEMNDEDYKPGQIVKKKNKRKLKVIKQAVSCESSENVNVSSQKVVGSCGKACRKNNKPFSCADTLKDNKDNQEHNPQSEDKLPQKSKIGDTQGKAVNKRKKTVADAKNKQETSGNRQRGKRKCGIFESEKTREGKRVLREVMKEIEEAQKRRLEDSPLPVAVSGTGLLNDNKPSRKKVGRPRKQGTRKNCHTKKLTGTMPKDCQEKKLDDTSPKESQSKKLSGTAPKKCQSKKLNSTAPKDCQCKKFTISALAKKQRKKNSSVNVSSKKVVKTLGEKKPQDHRKTRKRKSNKTPSTDMCAHASTVATSDWKPEESKASLSNEDREVGNKDKLVSAQDEFMSMSYIDQENSLSPVVCTEEPQTESSVAGGSSRSSMKSNPQIDHLRKCRSMLTKVTLSELSERLEQAHEYLRGIINGTIFSEKHKIFKEQGKACGSLLSIEVYAVFQEEQSEFMIDLMRKKYFEKLHLAIEDRSMRSQYIWKVLVPCFFIKLTMDLLNIKNEKAAQDKLMQICRNFAD